MINWIKTKSRPYRGAFNVLRRQGVDIYNYIHKFVPQHPELFGKLRKFKNIHKGERCFIVATGPSLTIEDVNKLKGEICWACNSGIKLFDFTEWRPDYYAICDGNVFEGIKSRLLNTNLKCSFYNHKDICWDSATSYPLPVRVSYVMDDEIRRVFPRALQRHGFSKDISKKVYMGGNITFVILQLCVYMGFREIYLLGCDCNYNGNNIYSSKLSYNYRGPIPQADYLYYTMIEDHKRAKRMADKLGVRIFNATRGGMLEVYPRVDLDEVLKERLYSK